MAVKQRITKLEKRIGGKHYLCVTVLEGETPERAIEREAKAMGFQFSDVGFALLLNKEDDFLFEDLNESTIDFHNHDGFETLIGWMSIEDWVEELSSNGES
jgi:hypothetical protein